MIELTQLERDVLSGKPGDESRKDAAKVEQDKKQQSSLTAENQCKKRQQFNELAALEAENVLKSITNDCMGFLAPITGGFIPTIEVPPTQYFTNHLSGEAEHLELKAKRGEIIGLIGKSNDAIRQLEVENSVLSEKRRAGTMPDTEVAGRVGLNLMDADVLRGVVARATANLNETPDPQFRDRGLEAWEQSTKDARIKALFSVITVCEQVITDVLRDLRASNSVTPGYSRTINTPYK